MRARAPNRTPRGGEGGQERVRRCADDAKLDRQRDVAVVFGPLVDPLEVEVLVLQGVGELVGERHPGRGIDQRPADDVHLLVDPVVVAGDVLGVEVKQHAVEVGIGLLRGAQRAPSLGIV